MNRIYVTFVVLLLSGCITNSTDDESVSGGNGPTSSLPEGETVLLATSTFMSHAGAGSVRAVPEQNVSAPVTCAIFRQGVQHHEDSCEILEGGDSHVEAPWHVSARFAGSGYPIDDPRRWSEKTIKGYNDGGELIATWNGASDYHPKHRRAIE